MKTGSLSQYELLLLLGLAIMVVFLLIIVTFSWIHQKKKGKEENRNLIAQRDQQARINELRIQQEEEERVRFARDLQKEIAELKSSIAELNMAAENHDPAFGNMARKLSQSIRKIENVSQQIAPAMLSESGLTYTLQSMVSQFNSAGKADLFLVEKGYKKQDDHIEIMLFRIAQEIVSNALKHGKPNRIDIFLTGTEKQIVLEIWDNGLPFDLKKKLTENNSAPLGNGLTNIASRLQNNAELMYMHFDGTNRNKVVYFV